MTSSHSTPPEHLDRPLELQPGDWAAREIYFLLTGLVIPRPIGWISTLDEHGTPNLAPHSYFNVVASDPPHVMFSSTGVKDTLTNVRATGEFVANIAGLDLVEEMNATATDLPPGKDEFAWVGLEPAPSAMVAPPRVSRAKAHLECRMTQEITLGNSHMVIGEVVHVHVDASIWSQGRVDPRLLDPALRLAGTSYSGLGEIFKLPRPTFEQLEDAPPEQRVPRRGDAD